MRVVELNNIDVFGKAFNGYSLAEENAKEKTSDIVIDMLVNHKLGNVPFVHSIYGAFGILPSLLEEIDNRVESIERKYAFKNQVSLTEEALIRNKYYKKADILHFHMFHNMHLPIEFLSRIKNKKVVIDLHDTFWLTNDESIPMLEVFDYCIDNEESLLKQRKRVLWDVDATFIVHSDYMARKIEESGVLDGKKIKLIPFGIDLGVFYPDKKRARFRKAQGINDDEFVILCRSQKEFKGIGYIEKALQDLNVKKKITVVTVQEKGLLDGLKSKYRIIELGRIGSSKKMARIYNMADLFLMPSTEESFGMMAIEAMACGLPVIVFEGTALPETVDAPRVGISTKKNHRELALAIERIIDNPDDAKMRAVSGVSFVRENYDKSNYYSEMLDLYRSLYQEKTIAKKRPKHVKAQPLTKEAESQIKNMYKELLKRRSRLTSERKEKIDYDNPAVQEYLLKNNKKAYRATCAEALFRNILWCVRKIKTVLMPSDR